jgi:hypothetical protein
MRRSLAAVLLFALPVLVLLALDSAVPVSSDGFFNAQGAVYVNELLDAGYTLYSADGVQVTHHTDH